MSINWVKVQFKDVAEVTTGSTPLTNRPDFYGNEIPFVTPGDLGSITPVIKTASGLTRLGAEQARMIPPNAVMVCCIGSLGKVGIAGTHLVTNQQINSLVFDEKKVFPRYGYHYCRTLAKLLNHIAPSTTVAIVNKSRFSSLEIPIPPLDEQKRIAAILDKADALREKRRQAIAKLDILLQSVFLDMFGNPVTNPKGWDSTKLKDVTARVVVGHVGPTSHGYQENGIPFLRTQNVRPLRINRQDMQSITQNFHAQLKKSVIRAGDVLISRVGANRGMAAVVPQDLDGANCANILIITPGEVLSPEFLAYLANSNYGQRDLLGVSVGSAQGVINTGSLKEWDVLLPPINLQRQFSKIVKYINHIAEKFEESINTSEILFQSLQQRAFNGELFSNPIESAEAATAAMMQQELFD